MNYLKAGGLHVINYEFQVTNYLKAGELQIINYELRVTSYE